MAGITLKFRKNEPKVKAWYGNNKPSFHSKLQAIYGILRDKAVIFNAYFELDDHGQLDVFPSKAGMCLMSTTFHNNGTS